MNLPIVRDIVLLGGGHTHALVVRRWGMQPLPGVRLTLVSQDVITPYSGMLPGYLAGHYSHEDIHLDLARLCQWAGIRFVRATVTGLDPSRQQVMLDGRPALEYDVLAVDTGSTPDTASVPGASSFTIPVKPVYRFDHHWQRFLTGLEERSASSEVPVIGVVGSGVGGFELLLAMQFRLQQRRLPADCHWFVRGDQPLSGHPPKVRSMALAECRRAGIEVHTGFDVAEVSADRLRAVDGREQATDRLFWCTAASGPDWPARAGLETDGRGFIATDQYLQSRSHPGIFATGDVGTQIDTPSPKAGVFAVRQAPVLFENLRRAVLQQPLKPYFPQKNILNLMALGPRRAVASRAGWSARGRWVWRWKDYIDQRFMQKFRSLPARQMRPADWSSMPAALRQLLPDHGRESPAMRCAGCAAKVPASLLANELEVLRSSVGNQSAYGVLSGLQQADDAAVLSLEAFQSASGTASTARLVQSVDQFRTLVDDPWLLGRIATWHALGDLYAMGATAHSVQCLVGLPYAGEVVLGRELRQLMQGVVEVLQTADCQLIGGHSSEQSDLGLGLVANGFMTDRAVQPEAGDQLLLTKPIGTALVLAAHMRGQATGQQWQACIDQMLIGNRVGSEIACDYNAGLMTDVTGFGLLGHLARMIGSIGLSAEIRLESIPLLPGVGSLAENGIESTLTASNRLHVAELLGSDSLSTQDRRVWERLLNDPQTNGGLLFSVAELQAEDCLETLRRSGYPLARRIGRILHTEETGGSLQIRLY